MIKTPEGSLGRVGALGLPTVGVPVVAPGQVLASGYYTDPTTGQQYYYNAALDQWYYVAAGLLYPLAITWKPSPSAKIDLIVGNVLRFNLTFKYIGPAVTRSFYAAIGANSMSGSFNEWSGYTVTKSIAIPAKTTPTLITGNYIDIPIAASHAGEDGAAYCKMLDGLTLTEGVNCTPLYYNVCHIILAAGEITEFGIASFVKV